MFIDERSPDLKYTFADRLDAQTLVANEWIGLG
jgi:hypothetical protein